MRKQDVVFISRKLKISQKKTVLLCEEQSDFDLMLEQVVLRGFKRDELQGLSFAVYIRLLVFKTTQDRSFPLAEKAAVASILTDLFPKMQRLASFKPFIKHITSEPTERGAKYYFIISSLFDDKVNCKDPERTRVNYLKSGLASINEGLSKNVGEWCKILREMKENGCFAINFEKELIPELAECPRV